MKILIAIVIALTAALPTSPQDRLERARQKMNEARETLDTSEKALISAYTLLEGEYEKISGPNCPDFLRTLSDVWAGQGEEIKKAWDNLSRLGKRVSERRFEEEIDDLLLDKAADITRVPPLLIVPFLRLASATAYDALRHESVFGTTEMLAAFQKILYGALSWNIQRAGKEADLSRAVANLNISESYIIELPPHIKRPLGRYRRHAFG